MPGNQRIVVGSKSPPPQAGWLVGVIGITSLFPRGGWSVAVARRVGQGMARAPVPFGTGVPRDPYSGPSRKLPGGGVVRSCECGCAVVVVGTASRLRKDREAAFPPELDRSADGYRIRRPAPGSDAGPAAMDGRGV